MPRAAIPIRVPTNHKGRRPVVPVLDIYYFSPKFCKFLAKILKYF